MTQTIILAALAIFAAGMAGLAFMVLRKLVREQRAHNAAYSRYVASGREIDAMIARIKSKIGAA